MYKVKTSKNTSLALDILDILGVKFIDNTPRLITHGKIHAPVPTFYCFSLSYDG